MIRALFLSVFLALCPFAVGEQLEINIGGASNDGAGDSLRTAFAKAQTNFTELYRLQHVVVGAARNAAAIQAAIDTAAANGGGDVVLPEGNYSVDTTLTISTSGIRLIGSGSAEKWGQASTNRPVKITYTGTGSAITMGGTAFQGCTLQNLHFDGQFASGAVDGLYLDGTTECTNLRFIDCAFTDFPRHQVYAPVATALWGISFVRCNFNDINRATGAGITGNMVQFDGTAATMAEITFDDCVFAIRTPSFWAAKITAASIRFIGGTVTSDNSNHGTWLNGGGNIVGTHYEGHSDTNQIAVRVTQGYGFMIAPSVIVTYGTGIEIGDPADGTIPAENSIIMCPVGANSLRDIHIVGGGSRWGTKLFGTSRIGGGPRIVDDHATGDGVYEVSYYNGNYIQIPGGTLDAPGYGFAQSTNTGISYSLFDTAMHLGRSGADQLTIGNNLVTTIHDAQVNNNLTVSNNINGKILSAGDNQVDINAGYHTGFSSLQVHAGSGTNGIVSILAYDTNNMALMLGSHMTNLTWRADSPSPAGIYKLDGVLNFVGDAGLTLGQSFVPTVRMALDTLRGGVLIGASPGYPIADATAILDLQSTNKMFSPPRMTKAQRDAISPNIPGIIYQTDNTPGFRFFENGAWVKMNVTADP